MAEDTGYISDLPSKTTLQNTDMLVIEDGQHTYKMTYQTFLSLQKQVTSFEANNVSGIIALGLTDGSVITVEPHDPSKVDKVQGKQLSTNDFTDVLKNKLDGIEAEANKYELPPATHDDLGGVRGGDHILIDQNGTISVDVDGELSASSTNPVQNSTVKAALDEKLNNAQKGAVGGLAELDANGKVPSGQLPSYVDDVIEGYLYQGSFYQDAAHQELITPESSKIYVDKTEEKTYRWGGSAYVVISESLALGETSSTAFRGDHGKTAYDHGTEAGRLQVQTAIGLYKVGVTREGHVAAVSAITKQDLLNLGLSDFSGSFNDLQDKPTIDATIDGTSTNAVQNKAVAQALDGKADKSVIQDMLLAQLDGTKATYDRIMKTWFDLYDAEHCTPEALTLLCENWYAITRKNWDGTVTFERPDVEGTSQVSTGTRGGDNAALSCTPSTNAVAGQDDYAGLPLFACKDVNFIVDATSLDVVITAIDGITSGFERNNPDKYVGVMQATGWHYWTEDETTYTHGYMSTYDENKPNIAPLPEAVRVDGTVRQFVVHGKYMAGYGTGGKWTCCSGQLTETQVSHNNMHTAFRKNGAQYSGGTITDDAFLYLMTMIKYASLTLDGIMNGCLDYNLQYYVQVAETGVKRLILQENSSLIVGSTVEIGTYNGSSTDRNTAANYNISGRRGFKITAIETVIIDETSYKAVYVDAPDNFDTSTNGNAQAGTTIVSSYHWPTGSCDGVLGNDGSPGSNTNSKRPRKLQGIEFTVGGYEVYSDVILNIEKNEDNHSVYVPYVTNRSANQATSITANYKKGDPSPVCPASASWRYIKRRKYKDGVFMPSDVGGSSSTYNRDAFYMNADGTTGTREWLAFGSLSTGLGLGGLSCLFGHAAPSSAGWSLLGRLSPNGNRGEWTA